MKNKRGFTLIELLAVIVILAIIALIATPAVLNIIEDSRKSAAEASARNIINAAKTYYMQETMNGNEVDTIIDLEENLIKYDGEKATKGYVAFETNGSTSGKIYINGYCVIVSINNEVESTKVTSEECDVTNNGGHDTSNPTIYKKYNDGDPVYFNPSTGVKCNDTEVVSTTGTKTGCMKFYAFLDSEDSSTVKLILDHNTTDYVEWNSDDTATTPKEVITTLESDTTGWKQIVNDVETTLTGRLITAEEVNEIAPTDNIHVWNLNDHNTGYYMHNGNPTQYTGEIGSNKYNWLFDNIIICTDFGCNQADDGTYGYWTNSYADDGYAWDVDYAGRLHEDIISRNEAFGVRPVIEVSKAVFE